MQADGAEAAIVDYQNQQICVILDRGGQFLAVHHEVAIACDDDGDAVREAQGGGDRGGDAIAHGAGGRGELAGEGAICPVAVPPAGEIAGAVADDRVGGQLLLHCGNAKAEV